MKMSKKDKPKKIGIASCLLGHNCRYNGKTKTFDKLDEVIKGVEVHHFCPEHLAYGTPREPMSFFQTSRGIRLLRNTTQTDLTDTLEQISVDMAKEIQALELDFYITKARSPSCGLRVPIVGSDETTSGIFISKLQKMGLTIYDEEDYYV